MTAETNIEKNALQASGKQEVGALALMTLKPEQYAAEIYQPFKTRLTAAIEAARTINYDITTGKGLEVVTKARRSLMDIRIEANKEREARKAPIIQIGKLLESRYKAVEEQVLPLETFFDGEIKAEEQRKENEKQAKIMAERLRLEAIQERIGKFGKLVLQAAGKGSEAIAGLQEQVEEIEITEVDFEELQPQATAAKVEAEEALMVAYKAAYDAEQAIEAARIKREEEDRQRREEAAKLEAQRAEQAKIAAAQAAEAKRLADAAAAQQAEIERQQHEAAAAIKAQADAETARQKAAKDVHDAEMKRQSDEIAAQRAEFEAQQQAAAQAQALADKVRVDEAKAIEDAAQFEHDYVDALQIDAEWEADKLKASHVSSSTIADTLIADSLTAPPAEPTDAQILDVYIDAFGGDLMSATARLRRFSL